MSSLNLTVLEDDCFIKEDGKPEGKETTIGSVVDDDDVTLTFSACCECLLGVSTCLIICLNGFSTDGLLNLVVEETSSFFILLTLFLGDESSLWCLELFFFFDGDDDDEEEDVLGRSIDDRFLFLLLLLLLSLRDFLDFIFSGV